MRRNRHGQVTAEMAVLFSFVLAALVAMGTYIQRGAQGGVKGNVDSLGQQFHPEGHWKSMSKSTQLTTYKDNRTTTDSEQCSHATFATPSENDASAAACTYEEDGG